LTSNSTLKTQTGYIVSMKRRTVIQLHQSSNI